MYIQGSCFFFPIWEGVEFPGPCQARGRAAGWPRAEGTLAGLFLAAWVLHSMLPLFAAVTKRGLCVVVEIKLEWVRGGGEEKMRKA